MSGETPQLPHNLLTSLQELASALEQRSIRYALVGAIAAGYRSRPRFTQDIDLLLDVPQRSLPRLLEHLRDRGFSFQMETVIREWTWEHMTAMTFRGVQVDWLKPVLPCYQHVIDRAFLENWLGYAVRVASAEDIILMKLLAFRSQDRVDIENLLAANRGQLDLDQIQRECATIFEPDHPRMREFRGMVGTFYREG